MTYPYRSNAHMRGMIVIAFALAACQALGASKDHARDETARNYEALVSSPIPTPATGSPFGDCDDRMDYGTGDSGCGSLTGGPAGGNTSRN